MDGIYIIKGSGGKQQRRSYRGFVPWVVKALQSRKEVRAYALLMRNGHWRIEDEVESDHHD